MRPDELKESTSYSIEYLRIKGRFEYAGTVDFEDGVRYLFQCFIIDLYFTEEQLAAYVRS